MPSLIFLFLFCRDGASGKTSRSSSTRLLPSSDPCSSSSLRTPPLLDPSKLTHPFLLYTPSPGHPLLSLDVLQLSPSSPSPQLNPNLKRNLTASPPPPRLPSLAARSDLNPNLESIELFQYYASSHWESSPKNTYVPSLSPLLLPVGSHIGSTWDAFDGGSSEVELSSVRRASEVFSTNVIDVYLGRRKMFDGSCLAQLAWKWKMRAGEAGGREGRRTKLSSGSQARQALELDRDPQDLVADYGPLLMLQQAIPVRSEGGGKSEGALARRRDLPRDRSSRGSWPQGASSARRAHPRNLFLHPSI